MDPGQNRAGNGLRANGEQAALPSSFEVDDYFQYPLPVGLFLVDPALSKVRLNTHLAKLLGYSEQSAERLSYQNFLQNLVAKTGYSGFVRENFFERFLVEIENPSLIVTFKDDPERHYKVFIFNNHAQEGLKNFGGVFIDLSADLQVIRQQMKILVDLCQKSRKTSAAAGGNLQALAGNLQTWNVDTVKDFILDTQAQVASLNSTLDLALNFINILYERTYYPETINFRDLLFRIIQDYPGINLYDQDPNYSEKTAIPVHLDPGLTSLAIGYLLDEISAYIQPDDPVDVVLTQDGDRVRVNLQSSRKLQLPGFSSDIAENSQGPLNPTMILAKNIIASQGGEVYLSNHSAEMGMGISVNLNLPIFKGFGRSEKVSLRLTKTPPGTDPGRVILVVPEPEYQLSIQAALAKEGYRVDLAIAGNTALDMVQRINPAAIITSRILPELDGLLLTQGIRRWSAVPIIMISSSSKSADLIQAFEAGVDDYLSEPILVEELILRLRSIIKRNKPSSQAEIPDTYHQGDIRIDFSSGQVWRKGNSLRLTPIEYNLLVYMARQGKQIMTYEQLLDRVWDGPEKGSRQGLFVHIKRLREKIESDPKNPKIIRNKWGVGYEFSP